MFTDSCWDSFGSDSFLSPPNSPQSESVTSIASLPLQYYAELEEISPLCSLVLQSDAGAAKVVIPLLEVDVPVVLAHRNLLGASLRKGLLKFSKSF